MAMRFGNSKQEVNCREINENSEVTSNKINVYLLSEHIFNVEELLFYPNWKLY